MACSEVQPCGSDPLLTLVETVEALSEARTVDEVAAVVRSQARRISGADGVTFVLRDGDCCWYLDEDAIGPLWKGQRFPLTACISGWAMLNAATAVIPDIYADERVPHDAYRPTFVKSLVMTPVRRSDPIAAIGAYWSVERHPSADEIQRLEVMARATAAALESARMYASLGETLERRKFLLRELDHRCKNTLASVQSIADQTLRVAVSPSAFVEAFTGRLGALSRAHELLTRGGWGRANLREVLDEALAAFGGADGLRISARGPAVDLSPETSVAMHMAFHELAVNAAKHGALGRPGRAGGRRLDHRRQRPRAPAGVHLARAWGAAAGRGPAVGLRQAAARAGPGARARGRRAAEPGARGGVLRAERAAVLEAGAGMKTKVLLVEDESLVALVMEDMLADLGCEVVAIFGALGPALTWLDARENDLDGALLDVNLGGELVFPLAEALARKQVPFVFATAYSALPEERFPGARVIHKPIDAVMLERAVGSFTRS